MPGSRSAVALGRGICPIAERPWLPSAPAQRHRRPFEWHGPDEQIGAGAWLLSSAARRETWRSASARSLPDVCAWAAGTGMKRTKRADQLANQGSASFWRLMLTRWKPSNGPTLMPWKFEGFNSPKKHMRHSQLAHVCR